MAIHVRHLSKLAKPWLLSVTPSTSMIDTQVAIKATGIKANSHVTIRSVAEKKTGELTERFESHAYYKAGDNGEVSVPDQASLGGSYTGIEPMGLFWSMVPSPRERLGARFLLRDATKPMVVQLSLYEGQLDTAALQTKEPEATAAAERWYMGKDVERIEVKSGRLRGALFKPKGPGPFAGVIDMFGIAGGLIEIRAAALASHGFASYALPYYAYKDLPKTLWNVEAEYFRDAVDWLCDQPYVKPGGIGIVGVSTGALLALQTSALFPEKVSAVISINGAHALTLFPITLNGEELPYVPFDLTLTTESVKGIYDTHEGWNKLYKLQDEDGAIIKLEKNPKCQYLFVAGEAERQWDSCYNAKHSMERLKRHGCSNYQLLSYPEAGHLIEVPWAPVGSRHWSSVLDNVLEFGGTPVGNIRAMEDSWPKMLRFLHRYCGHCNSKL